MDEESLPAIAKLLSGSIGASTRAATCATIAGCSGNDAGAPLRHLLGTTTSGETIIRRLLLLSADPTCSRLALSALVNISEGEEAAKTMVRVGAVERAAECLLDDDQRHHVSLYAGLLTNMTRFPAGVDALIGKNMGTSAGNVAVHRLLKLVSRLDQIPNVLWMSNACSTPEGRATLLIRRENETGNNQGVDSQPLTWLLRLLPSEDESGRLAAASAVRNCSMDESCHDILMEQTSAVSACLSRLISAKCPIQLSHMKKISQELGDLALDPSKAKPEPLVEIRLLIVESLLLMCKSQLGRTALWDQGAYSILEAWSAQEESLEVKNAITSTMNRISIAEDVEQIVDVTQQEV